MRVLVKTNKFGKPSEKVFTFAKMRARPGVYQWADTITSKINAYDTTYFIVAQPSAESRAILYVGVYGKEACVEAAQESAWGQDKFVEVNKTITIKFD